MNNFLILYHYDYIHVYFIFFSNSVSPVYIFTKKRRKKRKKLPFALRRSQTSQAMAAGRRIGRRSTINPGIILLSASNLLSEIEYLQPSSLEMRDIGALIDRVRAVKQNLRRLRSGSVEQHILDRIIRGLDEMRCYLEEIKSQLTSSGSLRGYNAPRVYTGENLII